MTEPFGRQPQPVHVMLAGEPEDVDYYRALLIRCLATRYGGSAEPSAACKGMFTIYPRAVND